MNGGLVAVGIRRLSELLEGDMDKRKKKEKVSLAHLLAVRMCFCIDNSKPIAPAQASLCS